MTKLGKEKLENVQCGDWVQVKGLNSEIILLIGEVTYIRKKVTSEVKLVIKIIHPRELKGESFTFYDKDESYLSFLGNPKKNPWLIVLYS